jgi:hypothetical protein
MRSPEHLANLVCQKLEPKMKAMLTDPPNDTKAADVHKLTTHVEKLTAQFEEHTKKFEEHTKLMNAKFEKQKRFTNWSFYLVVSLPVIVAVVDLDMNWMMMMRIDESSSSRWDMNGEAPSNSRVFCQYVQRTPGDGTIIWDGIVSAWNYTQHLYNVTHK